MDITLSYNASMLSNNNQSSVRQMSKPLSDSDTIYPYPKALDDWMSNAKTLEK
jgi:hypothetical protein